MERSLEGVVLLDVTPGAGEVFESSFLERNAHPVIVCHGPTDTKPCPLLGEAGCPKFAAAHGIVFELDLDRPEHRAIVERYRALGRPDLPIRVVVRPDQAVRYRDLLTQVQVWTHEPNVAELDGFAAEVEAVVRFGS